MQRFVTRQAMRLAAGVLGAILVAAAIAAAGEPHARDLSGFLAALLNRLLQFGHLNLGVSLVTDRPVAHELAAHLPQTFALVGMGTGLALVVGVPVGLLLTLGPTRRIAAPILQIITATPIFVSSLALAFFAVHVLHWPVSVNAPAGADVAPEQAWMIAALPILTVGLAGAAAVQLVLRRSAVRASGDAFRAGLKRMGLGLIEIEVFYVLPHMAAALFAGAREVVLALFSAAVVAEWVFHRAGAADLFVKSVALADWNMAAILLIAFATVTFVADFLGQVIAHALAPGARP